MPAISVRYFASIRERLGRSEERLELEGPLSAGDIWQQAVGDSLPPNTLVAINQAYARPETLVYPGDELAFFPPVTGGLMTIRVQQEVFDPWRELAAHEAAQADRLAGQAGAAVAFVGRLREFSQGAHVAAMLLEHYPGMTEAYLEKISAEARARWELLDTLIIHRFGPLKPDDPIVLVAAWSAHREAAFAAGRYLIDELKTRAPFWKQEQTPAGARWVLPE